MHTDHAGNEAMRNSAFPISFVTSGKTLLLVGGCLENLCRLRHAIRFDWNRILVAVPPDTLPLCPECAGDSRIEIIKETVSEEHVRRSDLVIESTEDQNLADRLSTWCRAHRVPLNAMDKPELCDLHYPALLFREPLLLSIVSGGDAPALSSRLRKWLEENVDPGWETAARLFAQTRNRLPDGQARSDLLKNLANDPALLDFIVANDETGMQAWINDEILRLRSED